MEFKQALKNPFNWLIFILIVLNVLPVLAPLFLHWGWEWAAKPIYFIYSFTCHQFAHRSLHIYDHQCAWCTRDMAIWGSMLVVALFVKKFKMDKGLKWYWVIPFVIPIALDGGIQTIATLLTSSPLKEVSDPLYVSTNLLRMITGSIFGIGLGLWMFPVLNGSLPNIGERISKIRFRHVIYTTFAIVAVSYVGFVGLWQATSPNYPPVNAVDFAVKSPLNKDLFLRREHGLCPTNALSEDPLALKCFLGQAT